jgi:hypothetical protein
MADDQTGEWLAVIGRALAFLCLSQADLRDKGLVPQARLLETLGLSRSEIARLLDTTDASLRELLSRERRRKATNGRTARGTKRRK